MVDTYSYEESQKAQWQALTAGGQRNAGASAHVALTSVPVIDTGAYTSGDCLGPLTTIANAARYAGGGGVIRSVVVADSTQAQRAAMDILLFSQTVTTAANNAAFTVSDADLQFCVAVIPILTTNYNTAWPGTPPNSVAHLPDAKVAANPLKMEIPYLCGATSLFMQVVVRGTPTYIATTDISVRFDTIQD